MEEETGFAPKTFDGFQQRPNLSSLDDMLKLEHFHICL